MADIGIRVVVTGVAEARRNIGAVQTDINNLQRTIERVSGTTTTLGRNLQSVGNALIGFGRTMTIAVTAPIAAAGVAVLEAGINFESAFAGIGKTVEGVMDSTGELTTLGEQIRQEFRDMALEVPIATNELARLGEVVGQLGVQAEDVAEVTEIIAMLGATTELEAEDAAKALIRFANNLGVASGDIEEFLLSAGSAIVALGNASVSTEGEILNLTMRLAAAGDRAKMTAPEILAWATTLSDLGVRAEMGGSALSRAINEMIFAIQSGSENLGTFAQVTNQTVDQFVKAFEEDASGALLNFVTALEAGIRSGAVTEDMLNELGLSGVRTVDVLGRLGDAQNIFNKNLDIANKAWEEQIALQEEFNKRAATVQSQIQLLKNAFTDLAIEIFDLVKDDVTGLIDGIKNVVKWFKELDPDIKKAIISFALLAAAIGPVLIVAGSLIAGLGLLVTGLGALLSPMGLATTAAIALGAGLAAIVLPSLLSDLDKVEVRILDIMRTLGLLGVEAPSTQFGMQERIASGEEPREQLRLPTIDEFVSGLQELGGPDISRAISSISSIGESFKQIGKDLAESETVNKALKDIRNNIASIGNTIKEFSLENLEKLSSWIEEHEDELVVLGERLTELGGTVTGLADDLLKLADPLVSKGLENLGNSLSILLDIIEGDWEGVLEKTKTSKDLIQDLIDLNAELEEAQKGGIGEDIDKQRDANVLLGAELGNKFRESMEQARIAVMEKGMEIGTQFRSTLDGMRNDIMSRGAEYGSAFRDTFENARLAVMEKGVEIGTAVQTAVSNAITNVRAKAAEAFAAGSAFVISVVDGAKAKGQAIIDTITKTIGSAISSAKDAAGMAAGIGAAMASGIAGAIAAGAGAIVDALVGAVEAAIATAMAKAGIASPSKVTWEIGEDMIAGLTLGLQQKDPALGAASDAVTSVIGAMQSALLGASAPITNISNTTTNNTMNVGDISGVPITSEDSLAATLQERWQMAMG